MRPGIKSPMDLDGRTFGCPFGSTAHYHMMFIQTLFPDVRFDIIDLNGLNPLDLYDAGTIDGAFVWGGWIDGLVQRNATMLFPARGGARIKFHGASFHLDERRRLLRGPCRDGLVRSGSTQASRAAPAADPPSRSGSSSGTSCGRARRTRRRSAAASRSAGAARAYPRRARRSAATRVASAASSKRSSTRPPQQRPRRSPPAPSPPSRPT